MMATHFFFFLQFSLGLWEGRSFLFLWKHGGVGFFFRKKILFFWGNINLQKGKEKAMKRRELAVR